MCTHVHTHDQRILQYDVCIEFRKEDSEHKSRIKKTYIFGSVYGKWVGNILFLLPFGIQLFPRLRLLFCLFKDWYSLLFL